MAGASVTEMMHAFSAGGLNVAEGYPQFRWTRSQQAIVDRFPELMHEAMHTPFPRLEARAQHALLDALGQTTAPVGTGRIMSYYAAGVAIDIVARCLARTGAPVAVVHPTLDCLPALIQSRGSTVVPLSESRILSRDPFRSMPEVRSVYIANPNNPTGMHLDPEALRAFATACERRGITLAIDSCFRAFDTRVQYDTYAVLDSTGVDYVVIEDTGKLWPVGGVRLSFLAYPAHSRLQVAEASADLLLNAPPFSALVVEAFANDMAAGGMAVIHRRLRRHREILSAALDGCDRAHLADGDSRVSMSLVRLEPGLSSTRLWGRLLRRGVHAVPGRPIWWARPSEGEHYLRVALARESRVIERAAEGIRAEIDAM